MGYKLDDGRFHVAELTRPLWQQVRKFFVATFELENKQLKFLGWKGPEARQP